MRSREKRVRRSGCPINLALELLGDTWSLLIVRDLMFKGRKTFGEFLNAEEAIASNILAERLQRLENADIVARVPDPDDARRLVYRLTERGIALAPVLVELIVWSARYERTDAPPEVVQEMRMNRARVLARIRKDWADANPS